jgi:nucleotide-binding universal stress UspA family protein
MIMVTGGRPQQRIVVGVDGSGGSIRALRWALREAQVTGGVVEAVSAWDIPVSYGFGPTVLDGENLEAAAAQTLATAVDDAAAAYPDVVVHQVVQRGHPAAVLIQQAEGAELLVLGSHGRGGFTGALLGSVSQHAVHHAACPVVVMRSDGARRS